VKFPEYRAKAVYAKHGIPVSRGVVVESPETLPDDLPYPLVVKAQVLAGGRGKAGGIRFAASPEEAEAAVAAILGMRIGGYEVRRVLLEPKADVRQELYLGVTIDRSARAGLLMASAQGGVDIEEVAEDAIFRMVVPPLVGLQPYVLRALRKFLALPRDVSRRVEDVARKVYALFRAEDAELVEINPLFVTTSGDVVAGDAKLTVDDNALYRHGEYADVEQDLTPLEAEAKAKGIAFIQLPGDIGVIANGAGLTMATLDTLNAVGGKGGTFLDLGGTDDPEKVKEAFEILLKAKPSVVLMNIFGGITKCDTVALGVKEALEASATDVPVVARIRGVNEEEAKAILRDAGMHPALGMTEAAEIAVGLRGGA
jgi:succinyl-CoA synthetase beta subunit